MDQNLPSNSNQPQAPVSPAVDLAAPSVAATPSQTSALPISNTESANPSDQNVNSSSASDDTAQSLGQPANDMNTEPKFMLHIVAASAALAIVLVIFIIYQVL